MQVHERVQPLPLYQADNWRGFLDQAEGRLSGEFRQWQYRKREAAILLARQQPLQGHEKKDRPKSRPELLSLEVSLLCPARTCIITQYVIITSTCHATVHTPTLSTTYRLGTNKKDLKEASFSQM